jgi:hypothetical protein
MSDLQTSNPLTVVQPDLLENHEKTLLAVLVRSGSGAMAQAMSKTDPTHTKAIWEAKHFALLTNQVTGKPTVNRQSC